MPVTSKSQIERMVSMCGASLPAKFAKIMQKYDTRPEALRLSLIHICDGAVGGKDAAHDGHRHIAQVAHKVHDGHHQARERCV